MSQNSVRGCLFALEGGDGAGKSTQARLLSQWLQDEGHRVQLTHEPGGTRLGEVLRHEVLHGEDVDIRTEALLYAADRAHHVHSVVLPALRRGSHVVTDRYIDSSIAYQGVARGLGDERIAELSRWATGGLVADLTILLDVDVEEATRRRGGKPDRLEQESAEFHDTVRRTFLDLAARAPQRYLVVPPGGTAGEVQAVTQQRVAALLAEVSR